MLNKLCSYLATICQTTIIKREHIKYFIEQQHIDIIVQYATNHRPFDIRLCDKNSKQYTLIPVGVKCKPECIYGLQYLIELKSIKNANSQIALNDTPICKTCNNIDIYYIIQNNTKALNKSKIFLLKGSSISNLKYEDTIKDTIVWRNAESLNLTKQFAIDGGSFVPRINCWLDLKQITNSLIKF